MFLISEFVQTDLTAAVTDSLHQQIGFAVADDGLRNVHAVVRRC